MEYLKPFVLASSWSATIPFFYAVGKLQKKNYSYYKYTLIAPVWLGFWNVISYVVAKKFGFTKRTRFLLLTLITYLLSIIIVKYIGAYNYTSEEWKKYYVRLFIKHFILWNIVVYYLEKYI